MRPSLLAQAKQFYKLRTEWLGEGGHPAPTAQQRANTCLACPHHDDQHTLEEAGKRLAVRATLDLKRRFGWHVEGEERLHLCGLCGCVLETKVFVPLELARANTPDWQNFIETCWMRTEQPQL